MAEYILEAGGTMAFTFHVLFMLFNLFIIYQFYFNDKFFNELGFSNEEPKLVFRGPLGAVFLTMLLMSILLTFDVTGNTYEENVVQYKFWYSFLFLILTPTIEPHLADFAIHCVSLRQSSSLIRGLGRLSWRVLDV